MSRPLLFLALRFSFATAGLLLALFHRKLRRESAPASSAGALAGVFLFSGYAFQTIGLRLTTAAKSAFITGLASVWYLWWARSSIESDRRCWRWWGFWWPPSDWP